MPVPKASVDENEEAKLPQDNVWATRQSSRVEAVPNPGGVHGPPNGHLWLGVLMPDPRHYLRPRQRGLSWHHRDRTSIA